MQVVPATTPVLTLCPPSKVSVEFIYRVKYGLLGKLMNALIIRKKFRGVANALLTNPAEYLKTGKMPGGKV